MLVYHPDPQIVGGVRFWILTGLPSRKSSPLSGWYRPNRMLTKVDLPAPFSPQKRVNFSTADLKDNVVVCDNARKQLGDMHHFYCIFAHMFHPAILVGGMGGRKISPKLILRRAADA